MKLAPILGLLLLATANCDKPEPAADKPAPSAAATPTPTPTPTPTAAPTPTPTSSATASDSAPTKDTVVSVPDPAKTPERTVKALAGGTVALYLPEWAGTTWKVTQPDKSLGKPKEETIPGFAGPTTPAHAFTWQIKDAVRGQTHKVLLTNTAKGRAPGGDTSFTLNIDVS